ncbi:MAG: DUF502 domain-containing protein [Alphaproteobacteria bacterium]
MNDTPTKPPLIAPVGKWRFGTRLRAYFAAGVLITAPIGITLYLAWSVIAFFDQHVMPFVPPRYNPETYLPFTIPGFGLVVTLVLLTLIGWLTTGILGRLFVNLSERVLTHMPVVRTVYGAIKQIVETTFAQRADSFRQVVVVEFPRPGLWAIGFLTAQSAPPVEAATGEDVVSVFCPTSPNPTSGYVVFVPRRDLKYPEMTVEEALKLIVSSGISAAGERAAEAQPERK